MDAFCTYCCKDKTEQSGEVPAIERYQSSRIRAVYSAALSVGQSFFILSGEYGLLPPCRPIPWYDYLLQEEKIKPLSQTVAGQLRQAGVQRVFYFTKAIKDDPFLKRYFDTIELACKSAGVQVILLALPQDA